MSVLSLIGGFWFGPETFVSAWNPKGLGGMEAWVEHLAYPVGIFRYGVCGTGSLLNTPLSIPRLLLE